MPVIVWQEIVHFVAVDRDVITAVDIDRHVMRYLSVSGGSGCVVRSNAVSSVSNPVIRQNAIIISYSETTIPKMISKKISKFERIDKCWSRVAADSCNKCCVIG